MFALINQEKGPFNGLFQKRKIMGNYHESPLHPTTVQFVQQRVLETRGTHEMGKIVVAGKRWKKSLWNGPEKKMGAVHFGRQRRDHKEESSVSGKAVEGGRKNQRKSLNGGDLANFPQCVGVRQLYLCYTIHYRQNLHGAKPIETSSRRGPAHGKLETICWQGDHQNYSSSSQSPAFFAQYQFVLLLSLFGDIFNFTAYSSSISNIISYILL